MTYETIEEAFFFVSSVQPYEHAAVVNCTTGETFYTSDMAIIGYAKDILFMVGNNIHILI